MKDLIIAILAVFAISGWIFAFTLIHSQNIRVKDSRMWATVAYDQGYSDCTAGLSKKIRIDNRKFSADAVAAACSGAFDK